MTTSEARIEILCFIDLEIFVIHDVHVFLCMVKVTEQLFGGEGRGQFNFNELESSSYCKTKN